MAEALIEIHDSEIIGIEKVLEILRRRQGQAGVNLEGFRQEAMDRFAAIGFKVAVRAYETDQEGVVAFDIDIVDRLAGEFDQDKAVWEATHDVLELGEAGVISTDTTAIQTHHHHH
jgi:hypothetical protein